MILQYVAVKGPKNHPQFFIKKNFNVSIVFFWWQEFLPLGYNPPKNSHCLLVQGRLHHGGSGSDCPPLPFVYRGSTGIEKCPFYVLVQYRSERLSFSQAGTSLTLAHLEGYCLAPADIQQGRLHQKGSGGCPCCYWAVAKKCSAPPLSNTVLNASFSRQLVTRSRSFKTVLPCPFQYIVHGCQHHYKDSSVGCRGQINALPFPLCTIPF